MTNMKSGFLLQSMDCIRKPSEGQPGTLKHLAANVYKYGDTVSRLGLNIYALFFGQTWLS